MKTNSSVFTGKTIYVEGCDFSGKTSLIKSLLSEEINNNTFLSDRSYATSIIYAQYFNRDFVDIFELENNFLNVMNSNKSFVWFLNPSNEEIIKRSKNREENHIKNIDEVLKIKRLYEQFFKKYDYYYNIRKYTDNAKYSIIADELSYNNEFNRNKILFDYYVLMQTLHKKEDHEILNYKFNYSFENLLNLRDVYSSLSFEIFNKANEIFLEKVDYESVWRKEEHERNMVLSNLQFNTHIMIDKYKESINSRRFLSINDSCFSYSQVNIRENEIHFTFSLRSTNVHKMLPCDFNFIFKLIIDYLLWLQVYSIKNQLKSYNIFEIPIKIDITLNSAHLIME